MEREQKQKNYLNAQRFVVVFTWLSSAAKEKHKTDYINMKLYPQQQKRIKGKMASTKVSLKNIWPNSARKNQT